MRAFITLLATLGVLTTHVFAQAAATLRSGDMFELRLSGVPVEYAAEFTLLYTVGSDGTVNIPLLRDAVRAAGLTSTQLQREIENRLISGKIFTHPTVIINVQSGARTVSVGGNVRQQGRVPWSNDLTLTTGISAAGGVTEFGGDRVRLIRNGQVEIYSRKKLYRDPAGDPRLLPGDQIDVL